MIPSPSTKGSYLKGAFWILMAGLVNVTNDFLFKIFGMELGISIFFFRCLFSVIFLLPLVLRRPEKFRTQHMLLHAARGGLFSLAMIPWCLGLIALDLPLMTTFNFTTPLFVSFLAPFFLKESMGWQRALATIGGFIGIVLSAGLFETKAIPLMVTVPILATLLFACLDIMNKHLLNVKEDIQPMMFFSALWTTIFTLPWVLFQGQFPPISALIPLMTLGLGANVLLWCLLKASASYDLSALQPLRYSEFFLSSFYSVIFFHQWPTHAICFGFLLIVPCTLYLSYYEMGKKRLTSSS